MDFAPIALFVYNRLVNTQRTIKALQENLLAKQSELFIFSDGSKCEEDIGKVDQIRNYLKTIDGFKKITIHEKQRNFGLANSIISGVIELINIYGKVIVVEDDLITSPYFLSYLNVGLNLYESEERVISIHGYLPPIKKKFDNPFFLRGADCWGWATWKRGWQIFESDSTKLLNKLIHQKQTKEFDFNNSYPFTQMLKNQSKGNIDSWAIRWYASAFLANKLTLYPNKSLVNNIGFDNSGTHGKSSNIFNSDLYLSEIKVERIPIEENYIARKAFEDYFNQINKYHIQNILNRIKKFFKLTSK